MIKSFLVSMFAVFLFALGATGAWFYLQMDADETDDAMGQVASDVSTEANPIPKPDPFGLKELPAVVRGPELNPDEMYRLSVATDAKREQLRQFEDTLRVHNQRIKAGDADTKAAQREIEGAVGQVRNLMDAADKLLDEVQVAMNELKTQQEDVKRKTDELKLLEDDANAGAANNIKTFAEYLQSMPPTEAAGAIKEMVNEGKMDFAIQLMRQIEPRNVSKILAELNDPALLAELASRYPIAPQIR